MVIRAARTASKSKMRLLQVFNGTNEAVLPPLCDQDYCTRRARYFFVDSEGNGHALCEKDAPRVSADELKRVISLRSK